MSHSGRAAYNAMYEPEAMTPTQRAFAEAPARDGRCFVETPAAIATAIREFLKADSTWRNSMRRAARTSQFYDEMNEAERECCRAMVEHQGVHARMAGYYEVDGVWVGFDKVSRYGLTLVVRRVKPVFAAKK